MGFGISLIFLIFQCVVCLVFFLFFNFISRKLQLNLVYIAVEISTFSSVFGLSAW